MRQPPVRLADNVTVAGQSVTAIDDRHVQTHQGLLNRSLHPQPAPRADPHATSRSTVPEGRLTENVLSALPKSAQRSARKMLAEIRDAEDRDHATRAADAFAKEFGAKWPKAVAKITDDLEPLLAFYDFPAEHWIHLKTTNPIESTFATVRLRTKVTKGPGSRAAGLAMAFKLLEAAQDRWRAVNGPHLVALVRAGARFEKGVIVEREPKDQEAAA
jgi:hypothetical protein